METRIIGDRAASPFGRGCPYSIIKGAKDILSLAVDENHRGHGIGGALLGAAEDWARQTGALGVRLVSGANRERAHLFYLTHGYTHRKDQKNFIKRFDPGT